MKRILFVLGSGGHTEEMLRLIKGLEGEYESGYLIPSDDSISEKKITRLGKVFYAQRARSYKDGYIISVLKTTKLSFQSLIVLIKFRPHAIISAGPGICVPISVLGKLFGREIIFVEDWFRIFSRSGTGRIMYHIADVFLIQHEELRKLYPKGIYGGLL